MGAISETTVAEGQTGRRRGAPVVGGVLVVAVDALVVTRACNATLGLPLARREIAQADGAAWPVPGERVLGVGLVHVPECEVPRDADEDFRAPVQLHAKAREGLGARA